MFKESYGISQNKNYKINLSSKFYLKIISVLPFLLILLWFISKANSPAVCSCAVYIKQRPSMSVCWSVASPSKRYPDFNTINLASSIISSESAGRFCQNYIIGTIHGGKTRFTVDDGVNWQKEGTFRDVLQSQAQPFVSWLNDFLSEENGRQHANIGHTQATAAQRISENSKRKLKDCQDFQHEGFNDLANDSTNEPIHKRSRSASTETSGALISPPPPSNGPSPLPLLAPLPIPLLVPKLEDLKSESHEDIAETYPWE